MATAKSHGTLHCKNKAQTSRFAFLFCNIIVDIFHFVAFMCSNTREVYRNLLHLLLLLISVSVGEHKVDIHILMVMV